MTDTTTRLNKRMAELGLCSRREADDWIAKGWVRVNGAVAPMGLQVAADARIEVDPRARGQQQQQVTILLHKPMGYVSGQAEDGHQPAVTLVQARNHWKGDASGLRFAPSQLRGLAPAGRLDIDSVGLLVLTQDGRVARQLIGEDSGTEKEYLVRVSYATPQGDVLTDVQKAFPAAQLARLRHGLSLAGALEAGICCLALREGFMPASAKIQNLDPACEGMPILTQRLDQAPHAVMSNSSGFGGANVALIFAAT